MDGTLQNKKYLNVKKEEVQKHLQGVLDEIIYFNGLFTVLWHNTHYSDEKYGGWKEVILSIIQNCKDRGSIFLNGNELRKLYGNNI
jgi:hypothetical protein